MFKISRHSRLILLGMFVTFTRSNAAAASKVHVIAFGKWTTVLYVADSAAEPGENKPLTLRVRALVIDGRIKEFTLGAAHDVTDRIFVIQRAFRVNDNLPQESSSPHWQWQRGGWLLVDRITARVSSLNLPEFDAAFSAVSWYRDYAAYWGVSDDGKQIYAVVAEINRRKPIMKTPGIKLAKDDHEGSAPDCTCAIPEWQRDPARVTFEANQSLKNTYVIRGHASDLLSDDDEEAAN
jgi:hypothetical protein